MTRCGGANRKPKKTNKTKKEEKPVNKNQFRGSWRQFKGEVKKTWGQLTDNDLLEIEGDYDKFLGVVQRKYGDRKGEIERWAEQWCERQAADSRKAAEARS